MVVELLASGKLVKEVSLDFDIRTDLIRRWRREYGKSMREIVFLVMAILT